MRDICVPTCCAAQNFAGSGHVSPRCRMGVGANGARCAACDDASALGLVPEMHSAISADPGQGRAAVMQLLGYGSIFLIAVWGASSSRGATFMLYSIAVFSAALAGFGVFAFATGQNFILGEDASRGVVQATFINRNNYATYAVFGALANMAAYLQFSEHRDENLRGRIEGFFKGGWLFVLGAILCAGAVSLTQSRGGGVAGLVGIAVFLLAWRRKGRDWDPVMLGAVAVFLVFLAVTSATGLVERVLSTDDTEGRFVVYPAVVSAILDRPVAGHGLGAFHDAFRAYLPFEAASGEWVMAHNTYLEAAFGFGVPAAFLFFAAQAWIFWQIRQGTLHRRRNRAFSCFALGMFCCGGLSRAFRLQFANSCCCGPLFGHCGSGVCTKFQ